MRGLRQYYSIKKAAGVAINIGQDGIALNACGVVVENQQLTFAKKLTGLTSIEQLNKHFPEKTIVALNLSGKGILQKRIEKIIEINGQNFNKILPGASVDDFYVQNFMSGEYSFISAIRKIDADKYISWLEKQGFVPAMLSLGPFPVENILSQLNEYGERIIFDGFMVIRDEKREWQGVEYLGSNRAAFPLKIESEPIDEGLLIPYAAVFQLVMTDNLDPIIANVQILQIAFEKLAADKKLKAYAFLALIGSFIILLINFLFLTWFSASNAKLTEQVSTSAQGMDDLQKMTEQIAKKDSLIKILGWEENIDKGKLIDQIAALLPNEITWKNATVDPVDSKGSNRQKSISFFSHQISITGNAERIIPVNEWIARIKTKAWIKSVQLESYTFNQEQNTGQFTILINY